jgi:hypothetical protein
MNVVSLAADLQRDGTQSFAKSWKELLECLAEKGVLLEQAERT